MRTFLIYISVICLLVGFILVGCFYIVHGKVHLLFTAIFFAVVACALAILALMCTTDSPPREKKERHSFWERDPWQG